MVLSGSSHNMAGLVVRYCCCCFIVIGDSLHSMVGLVVSGFFVGFFL